MSTGKAGPQQTRKQMRNLSSTRSVIFIAFPRSGTGLRHRALATALLRKASRCNVSHSTGAQERKRCVKQWEPVIRGTGLEVLIGASLGRARRETPQLVHWLQVLARYGPFLILRHQVRRFPALARKGLVHSCLFAS